MSFDLPPSVTSSTPATNGFVLGPDDGDAYDWLGSLTLTKVLGRMTTGNIDIVDHRVPPGYAPPKHIHQVSDEVFFLLEGELEVHCGDETWQAQPGSLVFLPRNVAHGFTNSDAGPARTLLINAPAGFGDLIIDLGEPNTTLQLPPKDGPMPSPDEIAAKSAKYGIGQLPPDQS